MDLITSNEMRNIEKTAMNKYGISDSVLMDCAATGMLSIIVEKFPNCKEHNIAVFCGPGNNGGDGYALSKKLISIGYKVTIFSSMEMLNLKNNALINAEICQQLSIVIHEKKENINLHPFDIIVDGLLGIGISRQVEGLIKKYIEEINRSKAYTISVDIPSGLSCDTGNPLGMAVYSDLTITFEKAKIALFTQPGFIYAKNVIVVPLNIPNECLAEHIPTNFVYDREMAISHYKVRKQISSKGSYGHVLVIAGSKGMTGAFKLCVTSCLRAGAGYVYCIVPESGIYEYNRLVSEAVCIGIDDGGKGYLSADESDAIIDQIKQLRKIDCIVIGPGLSSHAKSDVIIEKIIKNTTLPLIIDAQGLNDISLNLKILQQKKGPLVITPHPGEMSKLMGVSIQKIQQNRIEMAMEFALKYDTIVLLKGHKSIVTDGHKVYFNSSGNAGMATPGCGDVLAGIIGCKVAKREHLIEAVAYSMYLHGYAGDKVKTKIGENGLIASDLINEIMQIEREFNEEKTRQSMG